MAVDDVVGKAVRCDDLRTECYWGRREGCAHANGTASYDELRRAQSEAESCARDSDCWASWSECLTSDIVLGLAVCSKGLRVKC